MSDRTFRFGSFELDESSGELRKNGIRIRLQEQPFQILFLLLENPGKVIDREEIRRKLWPANTFVDFDSAISSAVRKLREALRDSADRPRFVETLPRRGYRFIAHVDSQFREAPVAALELTKNATPAAPPKRSGIPTLSIHAWSVPPNRLCRLVDLAACPPKRSRHHSMAAYCC